MKAKIIILLIGTLFFSFWSCEGQTTVKISQNCDTIVIESPALGKNLLQCKASLDSLGGVLNSVRNELTSSLENASQLETTLLSTQTELSEEQTKTSELSALIDGLKADLEAKPDTIFETVYETLYDTIINEVEVVVRDTIINEVEVVVRDTIIKEVEVEVPVEVVVRDTVEIEATEITIRGKVYPINEITEIVNDKDVDTILLNTCWDDYNSDQKLWLHRGGQEIYPHDIYIAFKETSFIPVTFETEQTIFQKQFQRKYKIERTRNHITAETTYKAFKEVPFQFYIKDSIVSRTENSVTVRSFGSENHGIKYYINGVLYLDFSDLSIANAGTPVINGVTMYRHTKTIEGLEPKKTYTLTIEGNSESGEIAKDEIIINTL